MLLLFDPYIDAFLVLALAFLIGGIMKSVGSPLRSLPYPVNQLANLTDSIARAITNACGHVLQPLDKKVGASLSGVAGLIDTVAGFIRTVGRVLFGTAALAEALALAYAGIRSLAHELHGRFAGIEAGVKTLEREFHGIEHQVKALEHALARGIGHDLRIGLAATEKEVAHIEHKALPAIRGDIATAEGEIGNLFDWIRGKADIIGAGTFVTAVTAALALVGNGWLGCKENPFSSSKKPCSLWGDLARFMPLLGLLTIAFDFEEFVDASEEVASFIGKSVAAFEGTFPISLPPLPPPQ